MLGSTLFAKRQKPGQKLIALPGTYIPLKYTHNRVSFDASTCLYFSVKVRDAEVRELMWFSLPL